MLGLNRHLLKWNETNSRVQCGHCPCARPISPCPNIVWMHENSQSSNTYSWACDNSSNTFLCYMLSNIENLLLWSCSSQLFWDLKRTGGESMKRPLFAKESVCPQPSCISKGKGLIIPPIKEMLLERYRTSGHAFGECWPLFPTAKVTFLLLPSIPTLIKLTQEKLHKKKKRKTKG